MRSTATLALVLLALAGTAQAHVTVDPKAAPAGGFQVVRFRVGHGCHDTATTTGLSIQLPPGVAAVRPQPKAGWTLTIDRSSPRNVTAVTWRGQLPPDQFDEFAIYLRLPATAETLYFPTAQSCGDELESWTEIPSPGQDSHALRRPAPALQLTPAGSPASQPSPSPDDGHHH
jgi:uncharacterized protein YcnI